jgi:hypothetical protein
MAHTSPWVLGATLGFAVAALLAVALVAWRPWRGGRKRAPADAIEMTCGVCHGAIRTRVSELVSLSPAERALCIRSKRQLASQNLAEYVCTQCGAAHCFVVTGKHALWAGVNLYQPQMHSRNCSECRKTLKTPPWKPGEYDGQISEAPGPLGDFGLVCSRCGAVSCVDCCVRAAQHRSKVTQWICPRCARHPIETFFFP